MQVLTAPGVMIHEIDKSLYAPAMDNTACFVMGFANRGEVYLPQEFTSRTAWLNYYGEPDTEAERYFYAAACEVLNQNGRLYCARLPYDNVSFEKVVGFSYSLSGVSTNNPFVLSAVDNDNITDAENIKDDSFTEIYEADDSISSYVKIVPSNCPVLFDLSAIDEYRTDEAKVRNNTFMIADIAFNSYNRILEDKTRKNENRELIGIMPVVTTAANAMFVQGLIDVADVGAYMYETIGAIKTLDATSLSNSFTGDFSKFSSKELSASDCARILNSKDFFSFNYETTELSTLTTTVNMDGLYVSSFDAMTDGMIRTKVAQILEDAKYIDEWNGQFQKADDFASTGSVSVTLKVDIPISINDSRFGWHGKDGDDSLPETVSQEAASYFPTVLLEADENGDLRFDRNVLRKIGVVVYKMYMDPTEGNKINFEPVEAYAGTLGKDDKDPDTGITTFIDTIINSQSEYINFFSNCFNTTATKKYYNENFNMYVVEPPKKHIVDPSIMHQDSLNDIKEYYRRRWMSYIVSDADEDTPQDLGADFDSITGLLDIGIKLLEDAGITVEGENVSEYTEGDDIGVGGLRLTNGEYETVVEYLKKLRLFLSYIDKVSGSSATEPAEYTTPSLGFYWDMVKEDISIDKSIYDGINKSFAKVSDINERNIDIVCDAGLANIASYLKAIYGNKGEYDLNATDDVGNSLLSLWKCKTNNAAVRTWKAVELKFDNFCKNVRKDCMFIADGLRPLVLQGQKKIIRPTKPANTIDSEILPYVKYITGLNTSYGAGYLDWFEQADEYTGDFFWCPPSIKAMGVYLNTDMNFMYWDAPAGLNRGVIPATDVAFSPTMALAGSIYEKNWNYAINYPQDGIVLEGQKTFQVKPSAFDRVNVRRLFCRLERQAYKVSRYFVYEGNTAYTRQRLVDALDPYFKEAKAGGGIYDYRIKCDEGNNTPETIDRNELHVAIGIKPVKTAEFIYIDFIALRTGGSWEEAGL